LIPVGEFRSFNTTTYKSGFLTKCVGVLIGDTKQNARANKAACKTADEKSNAE